MEAKHFKKRNAIYACLRQTDTHPSAEMVHALLRTEHPDISLATVYRNLAHFKSQGLIRSLGTVNGVERFDADLRPHVHFICTGCDRVLDLPEVEPPQFLTRQAETTSGCTVQDCQLTFTGLCPLCRQTQSHQSGGTSA